MFSQNSNGGLFGNNNSNNNNNNNNQQRPQQGSLFPQNEQQRNQFGQPNQQQQPHGGLFGQPNQSGGLFSEQSQIENQQQQPQPQGGLFGQPNQRGGIFNDQSQNINSNSNNQIQGGLFGRGRVYFSSDNDDYNVQIGGGFFGNQNQNSNNQRGQGFFGNSNQNSNNQGGGGLFGNQQQNYNNNQNSGRGRWFGDFNQNSNNQIRGGGGGFFGNSNQNPNNQRVGRALFNDYQNNFQNHEGGVNYRQEIRNIQDKMQRFDAFFDRNFISFAQQQQIKDKQKKESLISREIFTDSNLHGENTLQDRLLCIICLDSILEPVECSECERIFCVSCMKEQEKRKRECPACKEFWKPKKQAHQIYRNEIKALKYKCKCGKPVTLDNYEIHLKEECDKDQKENNNNKQKQPGQEESKDEEEIDIFVEEVTDYKNIVYIQDNGEELDSSIGFFISFCLYDKNMDFRFTFNHKDYSVYIKNNYKNEGTGDKYCLNKLDIRFTVIDQLTKAKSEEKLQAIYIPENKLKHTWGFLNDQITLRRFDQGRFLDLEKAFIKYLIDKDKHKEFKFLYRNFGRQNRLYIFFDQMVQKNEEFGKYRYIQRMEKNLEIKYILE